MSNKDNFRVKSVMADLELGQKAIKLFKEGQYDEADKTIGEIFINRLPKNHELDDEQLNTAKLVFTTGYTTGLLAGMGYYLSQETMAQKIFDRLGGSNGTPH